MGEECWKGCMFSVKMGGTTYMAKGGALTAKKDKSIMSLVCVVYVQFRSGDANINTQHQRVKRLPRRPERGSKSKGQPCVTSSRRTVFSSKGPTARVSFTTRRGRRQVVAHQAVLPPVLDCPGS